LEGGALLYLVLSTTDVPGRNEQLHECTDAALGNIGSLHNTNEVTRALDDSEPLMRVHAAWALKRIVPAPRERQSPSGRGVALPRHRPVLVGARRPDDEPLAGELVAPWYVLPEQ
jgi:hypothetical protein